MLIYFDFGMILDGFCVIPSADGLTGGAQREPVTPKDWRFAVWERSVPHVSWLFAYFIVGMQPPAMGGIVNTGTIHIVIMTPFSLIYIRPL